jgi:hypothetical protein
MRRFSSMRTWRPSTDPKGPPQQRNSWAVSSWWLVRTAMYHTQFSHALGSCTLWKRSGARTWSNLIFTTIWGSTLVQLVMSRAEQDRVVGSSSLAVLACFRVYVFSASWLLFCRVYCLHNCMSVRPELPLNVASHCWCWCRLQSGNQNNTASRVC